MPAIPLIITSMFTAANLIGRSLPLVTTAVNTLLTIGSMAAASQLSSATAAPVDGPSQAMARYNNRIRTLFDSLKTGSKKVAKEVAKDLAAEFMKDSILAVPSIYLLTDAISYWVFSDFLVKNKYHPILGMPTRGAFVEAVTHVLNAITSMLLVDILSNRDVGSDLAENVVEAFSQSILGDAVKAYVETVAGVDSADDDEIRDIVSEDVVQTPHEIAFLGARSGLDNYSAMAELYTGYLEGLNPYFTRAAREIEDNVKRFERGLSTDVFLAGRVIEKLGEDLSDAVYWFMNITDSLEAKYRRAVREIVDTVSNVDEDEVIELVYQSKLKELEVIEEMINKLENDDELVEKVVDLIFTKYYEFISVLTPDDLYYMIFKVLDRVGEEIKEGFEKMSQSYLKLKELRTVETIAQ